MTVRRHSLAVLLLIGLVASMPAPGADLSLEARRADFDTIWKAVTEDYVYLDGKHAWWSTVPDRYAQRVEVASTADAWATVVEDALSELHDFHVGVRPGPAARWLPVPSDADLWAIPDGAEALVTAVRGGGDAARAGLAPGDRIERIGGVPVATAIDRRLGPAVNNRDPAARQWALLSLVTGRLGEAREFAVNRAGQAPRTITLPAVRRIERPAGLLTSAKLPGGIGFIRFNNSLGDQQTVAAFDEALASLRDTRALILDLRDTPSGGNSGVALGVLGRFVATRSPYQRHRIPRYGQPDVERNWLEEVAPRGPFTYRRRLIVLVDHWTGSMGEGMAIGIDGMRRGTVIGTTMGQLAGSTADVLLPRTGLNVALPMEELFHVDGTPRHRWVPPVIVAPVGGGADDDPIIDRARMMLMLTKGR